MDSATLAWLPVAAAALLGGYSFLVEPRRRIVTRHEIRSPELPAGFDGKKIVQFSDTHLLHYHSLKRFEKLVETINSLEPDLVAFTGDLFDAASKRTEGDAAVCPLLRRIQAPLGKFAVYGNHDFGYSRRIRTAGTYLTEGGFDVLVNETRAVSLPDGDSITVSGLDDFVLGKPDPRGVLSKLPERGFHLLLAHEPDAAVGLESYPVALQLSGHSHGGQVYVPGVGAIIRTEFGKKYVRGMYSFSSPSRPGRPYRLYVNRGIGTTRLNVRFGNVPEIAVFTLRRAPSE